MALCVPLPHQSSSPVGCGPHTYCVPLMTADPPVVRYCLLSERGSNCPHHRTKKGGPVGCRKLPQSQQALRVSVHSPQAAHPDRLSELRARCQCLPHFTEEAPEVKDNPYTFLRLRNDQKYRCSWGKKKSTAQDLASGLRWPTERERAAGSECQALAVPFQLPPQASSACELDPGKLKQEEGASILS